MENNTVTWGQLLDHHVRGEASLGSVWLRTDPAGLVTGAYTMFGRTKKLVPADGEQWSLELGKLAVELELAIELDFRSKFLV
jgi:hypothetical protein